MDGLVDAVSAAMREAGTVRFGIVTVVDGHEIVRASGAARMSRAGRPYAARMSVSVAGEEAAEPHVVTVVEDSLYLRMPRAYAPAGRPWLKITGKDRLMADRLRSVFRRVKAASDATSGLAVLRCGSGLRATGGVAVADVATTRYSTSVDIAAAAGSAVAPVVDQARELSRLGVTSLDYTLWVDAAGLPRKIRTRARTSAGEVVTDGTYRAWGAAVHVTAPPRARVTTLEDMS